MAIGDTVEQMRRVEVREDESVLNRAAGPIAAVRKHLRTVLVITGIGGILGALIGFLIPPTYTAETRVAVGMGSLTSSAIAGFPLAAEDLASNYARYVNQSGVGMAAATPGVALEASQIPESNVIRIEATSRNAGESVAAASKAATELVSRVNDGGDRAALEATRADLAQAAARYGEAYSDVQALGSGSGQQLARAKAEEGVASAELEAQQTKLVRLISEDAQAAQLTVVREAGEPASSRLSMAQSLFLIGAVIGFGIAVAIATSRERRRGVGERAVR